MSTTIYITGDTIQMICGNASAKRITIKRSLSYPLAEGAIINGVITEEQQLKSTLEELKRTNKAQMRKVRLVIDSSQILTKHLTVPQMSRKQLLRVSKTELAEFEGTYDQLLYDYAVIESQSEDAAGAILCCAVEKKMVESFVMLFGEIGIKLLSVDIALNCAIKLVRFIPELHKQTFILTVLNDNMVVSLLFVNGAYAFSSRSRLLAERGSDLVASELSGKISSIIQFNKSQKNGKEIEKAYFCGMQEEELNSCRLINDMFGIESSVLPDYACVKAKLKPKREETYELSEYLFGTGAILRK